MPWSMFTPLEEDDNPMSRSSTRPVSPTNSSFSSYQQYPNHPVPYDTTPHHLARSHDSFENSQREYGGFSMEDTPWAFASSSSIAQQHHHQQQQETHGSRQGLEPLPSPVYVPPPPERLQEFISDNYMAGQHHWGPFVPVETPNSVTDSYVQNGQRDTNSTQSPWSVAQPLSAGENGKSSESSFLDSLNQIFPNNMTPPSNTAFNYPGYFPPTHPFNLSLDGHVSRKGKEKHPGDFMEDFVRDLKRSKSGSHNEFEKDIALIQTYLTDLIGLLQPFATSPTLPDPPKPPPFLHTRFLRLTASIHQTLVNLAPVSHPRLAQPGQTSSTYKTKGETQTTAEQEMELIRKRRDWLIAKAAQTKAINNATSLSNSNAQDPSPRGHLDSYGYQENGHFGVDLGDPVSRYQNNMNSSLAYERKNHPGRLIGKTLENPSGRCHSCGIQGAIEWKRGPDGARSLCDSCGSHYARLSRRRTSASQSPS